MTRGGREGAQSDFSLRRLLQPVLEREEGFKLGASSKAEKMKEASREELKRIWL